MAAYNVSPVRVSGLADVQYANIISYDVRITNGTLTDLVRYVIDRKGYRETHQFLYYNMFGLPEAISFSGLVQYNPELVGDIVDMVKQKGGSIPSLMIHVPLIPATWMRTNTRR